MSSALTIKPLLAKSLAAVTYQPADATGHRLKTYDGTRDFVRAGGLVFFIQNTSGVQVTAHILETIVVIPLLIADLVVPAGGTRVFGPVSGVPGHHGTIDVTWTSVAGVSLAVFDATALGRFNAIIPLVTGIDAATDVVTLSWHLELDGNEVGVPSWATFDVLWQKVNDVQNPSPGDWTVMTNSGVTTPYAHAKAGLDGHGFDIVASGGRIGLLRYWVIMKDASGTAVGWSDWTALTEIHHA